MRLDGSTFGLLSCLISLVAGKNGLGIRDDDTGASGTSTSSNANSVVVIDTAFPTPAIFSSSGRNQTIVFGKGTGISELTIYHVDLKTYDDDENIGGGDIPTSSLDTSQDETSGSKRRRQLPPLTLPTSEDSVTLPFGSQFQDFERYLDIPLYVEFLWYNSTSRGYSSSPVFAFYSGDATAATQNLAAAGTGNSPAVPESITASSGTSAGSPSATATSAAEQSSSGGSRGLSTGPIAGIAVGCVVAGLLIIGAIVWCLCRRRRGGGRRDERNRVHGYASDSVTQHAMIGDKEIPGISESTPRSTYGGEEGVMTVGAGGAGAAAGGTFGRTSMNRSMAAAAAPPYSDRAPSPTLTPPPPPPAAAAVAAGFSGHRPSHSQSDASSTTRDIINNSNNNRNRASTPPVMSSSRYAHLVEEGMTEAEIRRLEEEERQLDEAIEDAGRHRRTASR
ncbi:hypothetical protein F4809DRAFT_150148 [Biscogniauxia mediterranea]|nr:hypothetical protein F4809DRAFT_150148 [Biscogniauxia mediterranea]